MNKKFFIFSLIIAFFIVFSSICYASDVVMDLNSMDSNTVSEDNTIYSSDSNSDLDSDEEPVDSTATDYSVPQDTTITSTVDDYEDSGELSITNMINIILIVVGIVLILLGIAIIIKLK